MEQPSKTTMSKRPRQKGPMDLYMTTSVETIIKNRKEKQTTINEVCNKELRERVCRDIARWFYDNGIPFNTVRSPSFATLVESIGQFGPGMKPPSYHEIRVPLLNKEVESVNKMLQGHKEEWAKYG